MLFRRVAAVVLAVGALSACSVARDPAQELRAQVPAAASLLEKGAGTAWSRDGAGNLIATMAGEAKIDLPPGAKPRGGGQRVQVSLGERYEDGYAVAPGGSSAYGLRVKPLAGSGPVTPGADGLARAADIQRGVDALHVVSPDGLEELLLSRDPTLAELGYEIERGPGIEKLRIAPGGYVEALDARGEARLRAPVPEIIDAAGKRVSGSWTLRGDQLVARWSNEGLEFPIAIDPGWYTTSSMATARKLFAATQLTDSRVLVTGGQTSSGPTALAEIFDPADGLWTSAGSMLTARYQHTATLLPNGTVLVAGGYAGTTPAPIANAEIFNGAWLAANPMSVPHGLHTATLLASGTQVLIAGGTTATSSGGRAIIVANCTSELYTISSGNFTVAVPTAVAHFQHTTTLLGSGSVLLAGGRTYTCGTTTATGADNATELFNSTATSIGSAGTLNVGRSNHTATLMPNGAVLLVGGLGSDHSTILPSTEIYNLNGSGAWSIASVTTSLSVARMFHSATLLPSGQVLIYGGTACGSTSCTINFSPQQTTSSEVSSVVLANTSTAPTFSLGPASTLPRDQAAQVLLPSARVLAIGGGVDAGPGQPTSPLSDAPELDNNSPTITTTTIGAGAMTSPTVTALTILPNSPPAGLVGPELLVVADFDAGTANGNVGGTDAYVVAETSSSGTLSVATTAIAQSNPFPHAITGHSATLLMSGKVLIAGGSTVSGSTLTMYADCYLFDPATRTVTALPASAKMLAARANQTATLLPDGRVLVVGGDTGGTVTSPTTTPTMELFDPAAQTWSSAGSLPGLSGVDQHTATLLANADVLIVGGQTSPGNQIANAFRFHPATNTTTATAPLVTARAGHTATLLPDGELMIAGGYNGAVGSYTYPGMEIFEVIPVDAFYALEYSTGVVAGPQPETFVSWGDHTAVLLPTGDVFYYGGNSNGTAQVPGVLLSRNFYTPDHAQGVYPSFPSATGGTFGGAGALLPSGRVAMVGGTEFSVNGNLAPSPVNGSAITIFDLGRGFVESWRPRLAAGNPGSVAPNSPLALAGTQLRGFLAGEASSGTYSSSPTNFPLVQVQRVDADYEQFLPLAGNFSATAVTNLIPAALNPGWYRVTVFANGIPSYPQFVEVGVAGLSASSSPLAFGNLRINTTATATFTLSNTGSVPLTSISYGPTGAFSVLSGPSSLAAGASGTVTVLFAPTARGAYASPLVVTSGTTTLQVSLTGNGVLSNPVAPATATLPNTRKGSSSTTTVTLTNTSGTGIPLSTVDALNITSASVSGGNAADFAVSGGASSLAAGGSAVYTITFTPSTAAAESTTLSIVTDNGTLAVAVSGTGIFPAATLSATATTFASVAVGSQSATTVTLTLTNSGSDVMHVSGYEATGAFATDFAIAPAPAALTLAAGASQQYTVNFTPRAGQSESVTITFQLDNGLAAPSTTLSGTGLLATATLSATSLSFGNQTVGVASAAKTVSISNGGNTALTIIGATSSSSDFVVTGGVASIAAGANNSATPWSVTFKPSVSAPENAQLNLATSIGTLIVSLSGTGIYPVLTVTPTAIAFGNQRLTTTSTGTTVTVKNSGTDTLHLTGAVLSDTTNYALTGTLPATLAASATATVSVAFKPQSTGVIPPATLTISSSDANISAAVLQLTGSGIYPALSVTPATAIIAATRVNSTTTSTVTLTNTGSDTLTLSTLGAALSGNTTDFSVSALATGSLAPGASTTLTVSFKPLSTGSKSTTLTITSSDAKVPGAVVTLSGAGIYPALSVTPAAATLAATRVGSTTTALVTLTNTGTDTLTLSTLTTSLSNTTDFAISALATGSLAASASTTLTVTFKPQTAGSKSATLTITSADPNVTGASVALTGVGNYPALSVTPASSTLASTRVGSTATGTITLTNTGTDTLTLSTLSYALSNTTDFALGTAPTGTLAAAAATTLTVTFKPQSAGSKSATVTVSSSDASLTISGPTPALTGVGIFPAVTIVPSSITFGDQAAGTSSVPQTIVITNSGTDTLNFSSTGPSEPTLTGTAADFALTPASNALPKTLAAGASTSFTATFAPQVGAPGSVGASISIPNVDGLTIPAIALSGNVPSLGSSALAIPDTVLGSSSSSTPVVGTNTVQLTNPAAGALAITSATISGADASDFSLLAGSPGSIAGGASGAWTVIFKPGLSGNANGTSAESATLTIVTPGGSYSCALTSNSLYPVATLSTPAAFPATPDGSTSGTSVSAVLTNAGKAPLSVTGFSISGADASDFKVTSTTPSSGSPLSVAAGATSTITFSFTPRAARVEAATFGITSNSSGASPTAALGGSGLGLSVAALALPDTVYKTSSSSTATAGVNTVSLQNPSASPLSIISANFSGANASDFSLVAGSPGSIAAGGTGSWTVVFTPNVNSSSTGKSGESATLTIGTASGNLSCAVAGNSVYPVATVAWSGASNFPPTSIGSTSSTVLTATITNSGVSALAPMKFSGLAIGGTDASDFAITSTLPTAGSPITIASGASSSVTLTFKPTATPARPETALLTFTSDGGNPALALAGSGAQATASISPTSLTLVSASGGSVRKGATSAAQTVTITNNGNVAMTVNGLSFTGLNTTDFSVSPAPSGASPVTIQSGTNNTAAFTITFTPKTAGAESATLTFVPASGSPAVPSVSLAGTGIYPQLSVQPSSVAFANQAKGTSSAPSSVVITNTGSDTLNINAIALSNSSDFSFSPALPALPITLAASASKTLGVVFSPQSAAALSSTLTVTSNDFPGSPGSVAISGTGVLSTPTLAPTTLALPDTAVGSASSATASAANTVTLSNGAGAALAINSVTLTGANKSDFSVAGGASSIGAGQSASWVVVFKPGQAGAESATLTFATDNGNFSTSLSGNGVSLVGAPASLAFGTQRKGTASVSQAVTLTNSGSAALTVSPTSSSADFVAALASGSALPIAAGKSATWNVVFTPSTAAAETAALTFATNLGSSTVALSGTGIYPALSVQPAVAAFGNQRIKTTSAALDVVITNTGTDTLDLTAPALSDATDYTLTLADGGSVALGDGGSAIAPLAQSGSATLLLKFHPQATGAAAATVTVGSGDPGITAQSVSVSGNGTSPNPHLSANALAFGNQAVALPSPARSVLVTNPGGASVDTLNITSAAVVPIDSSHLADAADFLVAPPPSGSIAPGAAGAIWSVVFVPSAPPRAESVTLTLQSDSGPLTVALSGTGIAAAASAVPPSLVFDAQPKGTSSQPLSVALVNSGSDALSITSWGLSGTNFDDFSVSTSAGSIVLPTAATLPACSSQPCPSLGYFVIFTPSTLSAESATLTFETSAGPVAIPLLGASVGAALVFTPASVDFGSERVLSSATAVLVEVTNAASQTLTLNSFELGGANANDFSVAFSTSDQSFPLTMASGATASFLVDFTPSAVGPRAATLAIGGTESGSDAGTDSVVLPLSGNGIAPTFDLSPSTLDFGQVRIGASAAKQTVTIANHGTDVLHIRQVALSGAAATSFALTLPAGSMPVAVALEGTYAFQVDYTPAAIGSSSASLVINTDDPIGGTATVPLSGEGISPQLAIAPIKLAFGAVRVGGAAQALPLALSNSGGASTHLNSATITGAAAADFTLPAMPPLPVLLAGGGAQSLVVLFSPGAHGDRAATLVLGTDVGPVSVPLSGSGLLAGIGVQPAALDFGSVALGADPKLLSLQIQNTGDAPLDLSLLTIDGPSALSFRTTALPDAGPLAPADSATFSVEYAPAAAATDNATLHLNSSDPSTPGVAVSLTGVAVTPALTVTGPITFDLQKVGTAATPKTVTITNTSAATLVIESVSSSPADFEAALAGAPVTLAPGATATATVTFTPTKAGAVAGTLAVFVQGASTAVATAQLSGVGQAASTGCGCSSSGPAEPGTLFELALFAAMALKLRRRRSVPAPRSDERS